MALPPFCPVTSRKGSRQRINPHPHPVMLLALISLPPPIWQSFLRSDQETLNVLEEQAGHADAP